MRKLELYFGLFLATAGLLIFIRVLTGINIWGYLWPALLIVLGALMVLRPHRFGWWTLGEGRLLGDIRRWGHWQVENENLWCLIGDVKLDLTAADIPPGETQLRVYGLIGDVRLDIPPDVGYALDSTALITSANIKGYKQDFILTPYSFTSDNYANAERRVSIQVMRLINDLKVR